MDGEEAIAHVMRSMKCSREAAQKAIIDAVNSGRLTLKVVAPKPDKVQ